MSAAAKYRMVFSVAVAERLVYRTDFFLATFLRFIPIVTTILLWRAIFDGSGLQELGGLDYSAMISYYLLVMIVRAFGSMPQLSSGIARDVRDGDLRRFLLQPINYILYQFVLRAAHKGVYFIMAAAPFAIVLWLCRGMLPGWPASAALGEIALCLVLSFVLGFLFNCLLGLLAFWFLEIGSIMHLVMTLQYFLSGHMFPLSLLPDGLREVIVWMPFAYETYYPTMLMVGRPPDGGAAGVLLGQVLWIIVLGVAVGVAWKRGLRRYAAYGG